MGRFFCYTLGMRLWFKNKTYGWGWTPATWEGWLVLAVFIGLFAWNVAVFGGWAIAPTNAEVAWYLVRVGLLVTALLLVCYKKGEKPGWHWGTTNKKNHE